MTTVRIAKVTFRYTDFGDVLSKETRYGYCIDDGWWNYTDSKGMWDLVAAMAQVPGTRIQCVPSFETVRELNPKGAI